MRTKCGPVGDAARLKSLQSPGSGRLRGRLAMDPWRSSQALVPPDLPTPKELWGE